MLLKSNRSCGFSYMILIKQIIVYSQFVPFRDFLGRGNVGIAQTQARLAKEVLAEIPEQFLSYMEKYNYKPKPPLQRQPTLPTAPPHWV